MPFWLLLSAVLVVAGVDLAPLSASASASADSATGLPTAGSATPSSAPEPPGQDPFYRYSGRVPLARVAPGTVLKQRSIDLAIGTTSTPVSAEQLLYRTTGESGRPTVTVTTVLAPLGSSSPTAAGGLPELLRRPGGPVRP